MLRLNANLVEYLCEFLEAGEVLLAFSHVCSLFYRAVHRPAVLTYLSDRELGSRQVPRSIVPRLLIQQSATQEKVLQLRAVYTSGGVYKGRDRYKLQNMFDYSGSAYTTSEHTENVTAVAVVCGESQGGFFADVHEDLDWYNVGLDIPRKYSDMPLLDDTLLTSRAPRRIREIQYRSRTWSSATCAVPPSPECREGEFVAVVNRLAVGRPALATCPIRTLLVTTSNAEEPTDLSQYFNLTCYKSIEDHATLSSMIRKRTLEGGFECVEFSGSEGPLAWVQFQQFDLLQVEVLLSHRRTVQQVSVLLIDIEDRTSDYGTRDRGIDINYVVFTGWLFKRSEFG